LENKRIYICVGKRNLGTSPFRDWGDGKGRVLEGAGGG